MMINRVMESLSHLSDAPLQQDADQMYAELNKTFLKEIVCHSNTNSANTNSDLLEQNHGEPKTESGGVTVEETQTFLPSKYVQCTKTEEVPAAQPSPEENLQSFLSQDTRDSYCPQFSYDIPNYEVLSQIQQQEWHDWTKKQDMTFQQVELWSQQDQGIDGQNLDDVSMVSVETCVCTSTDHDRNSIPQQDLEYLEESGYEDSGGTGSDDILSNTSVTDGEADQLVSDELIDRDKLWSDSQHISEADEGVSCVKPHPTSRVMSQLDLFLRGKINLEVEELHSTLQKSLHNHHDNVTHLAEKSTEYQRLAMPAADDAPFNMIVNLEQDMDLGIEHFQSSLHETLDEHQQRIQQLFEISSQGACEVEAEHPNAPGDTSSQTSQQSNGSQEESLNKYLLQLLHASTIVSNTLRRTEFKP